MAERRRSAIRTAVVWEAVQALLQARSAAVGGVRPLQVIDLGGGTGGLAVRIADLGHSVVVVDPSPDALAALERRAAEADVTAAITGVLGDAASLLDVVSPGSADVVVCHGVLENLDEPIEALHAAAGALVRGGCLSVLAASRSAAVFARALAGHLAEARALLSNPHVEGAPRRFTLPELESLVEAAGFTVAERRGVRVFIDHISSAEVDCEPGAAEALGALEADVAMHPDFMAIATQLHVLAIRD